MAGIYDFEVTIEEGRSLSSITEAGSLIVNVVKMRTYASI